MSLIEMSLKRRSMGGRNSTDSFKPNVEQLEARECPSVTAPTGLQLTALSPTQVKVTWNDVVGESGYRVFRWNGTQTILVTTVAANVKTFTVGQLPANQMQYFTVEAFDISTTARSAWMSITTPPDAITAPTNVQIGNIGLTQMTLSWTNAVGATGYRIFMWDGFSTQQIGTATRATPAFRVTGLTQGTAYYFYIQAFNNTNMANSGWVNANTLASGITPPANFKAQVLNANTVGLSWNDVAGETGYRVYRWSGIAGDSAVLIASLAANTTGYQATGLLPGRAYSFYIQAFNATNFANTTWVTVTTPTATPLAAPSNVAAAVTGFNSIRVTWSEPARAVGYRVFLWNGVGWTVVATVSRGTTSATINGLAAYRTHWFLVQAFTDGLAEVANSGYVFANL